MATKAFKSEKIDALKSKIEKAQVAIVTEYKGYTVEEITNLRRALQKDGGDYTVVKNTLAKIAVKDTPYEILTEKLTGPIALAFGYKDPVSPAKAVSKFIKDTKKGVIIGAALDGKLLTEDETKALANLPSKEELYGKSSFKRRTLRKNAWLCQLTCYRYCWFNQCGYGSTYKSYGSCQRSKGSIGYLLANNLVVT